MDKKKDKDISFEDKIKELESIVKELESGEVNLDDAINKHTKAMALVPFIKAFLVFSTLQLLRYLGS